MILRILALLTGIPLLLLGLLATIIAVGMIGDPGQQGGPTAVAAQIIVVVFMVGVTTAGALLCWLGLRKHRPRTAEVTPVPNRQPAAVEIDSASRRWESENSANFQAFHAGESSGNVALAEPSIGLEDDFGRAQDFGESDEQAFYGADSPMPEAEDTFHIGTSGQLIGTCGPGMSGQLHYYVIGGVVVAVGLAMMIVLQFVHGAADPAIASKIGLWGGGGLMLFGATLVALQLTRVPQIISLYDDHLEVESGSKLRRIALDQIAGLHVQEFYEHRFAPQTLLVTVHIKGDRKLKFSTALGGDAELIVSCLADIAPDVVFHDFG